MATCWCRATSQGRTAAVICQHGLSGRPEMITGLGMTEDTAYHEFGRRLAEQGYVVFAPLILHHHPVELTNRQAPQADALGMMRLALVRAQTERVIDFLQSLPVVDPPAHRLLRPVVWRLFGDLARAAGAATQSRRHLRPL